MTSLAFNAYLTRLLGNSTQVRWDSDTIKATLHSSSLTPNADTQDFFDDVSATEVGASGTYAAGGATLSPTVSQDDTDDEGVVDNADLSFTGATIAAQYLVFRKFVGTDATDPLLLVLDFGSVITSTAGTFSVVFASEGILNIG